MLLSQTISQLFPPKSTMGVGFMHVKLYVHGLTYVKYVTNPVNMPLCASTGPVLARCWQHRTSTGPVLATNGMFIGTLLNLLNM